MSQYIHYQSNSLDELSIILPGSSLGFQTGLINKIFNRLVADGKSAVSYNYPFLDRGEQQSSGEELAEEIEALKTVLQVVEVGKYRRLNFIGKSLGGIVATHFLSKPENRELLDKATLAILGYIKGSTNLEGLLCPTIIIQGENDRFGGIDQVKQDLEGREHSHIQFVEIAGADHSYRDQERQPIFEDQAIEVLLEFINNT